MPECLDNCVRSHHYGLGSLYAPVDRRHVVKFSDTQDNIVVPFDRRLSDNEVDEIVAWLSERIDFHLYVNGKRLDGVLWAWVRSPMKYLNDRPPRTVFAFYKPEPSFLIEFKLRWS